MKDLTPSCIAFSGAQRIAEGGLHAVAAVVKQWQEQHADSSVLIFDDQTSEPMEIDLRGTVQDVLSRLPEPLQPVAEPEPAVRTAGRPKLGVVSREVTLLPRHWEWLSKQSGGASVALRKLVEAASRANEIKDRQRQAQEATYRFMSAIAGNLPGYEEATRALFADQPEQFGMHTEAWPLDIREHARKLALRTFLPQG
ncbi:MAG: DUF2239 family protein [Sideroxydans sp.]|nr:DUF2239 family protein [Sideroxydans sp.]